MEFLVEFEVTVPENTPKSEVKDREDAEAVVASRLIDEGRLVRVWTLPVAAGPSKILGLYRASTKRKLEETLRRLPLYEWMHVGITPLEPHPNDPTARTDALRERSRR